MLCRIIPIFMLALACSPVSNTYQDDSLLCGAELPRGKDYFTVSTSNGDAMTTGFEVVDLETHQNLPLITRNGCVQMPAANSYLIRSQVSEEAIIIERSEIRSRENVRLLDYSHDSLTIDCSELPRSVSRSFTPLEIIRANVQNNLVPAFDVQFEMEGFKQTMGLMTVSQLQLLSNAKEERIYNVSIKVSDLLKKRSIHKICQLSLDSTPPQVDIQINARPAQEFIEVHGRKDIVIASPSDSISFQGDVDTASIRYCVLPLNDDFENLGSEAGKTWLANTEASDCREQVQKEVILNQPLMPDIKSHFWALRFQAIDAVGNAGPYHSRILLLADRDAQRFIRDNARIAVLTKKSMTAVTYALSAESRRRQLPTRYERLLSKEESLSGLLRAYYQEGVGIDSTEGFVSRANHRGDRSLIESSQLRLIEIESQKIIWSSSLDFTSKSTAFSHDDSNIFVLGDERIAVLNAETGASIRSFDIQREGSETIIGENLDGRILWTADQNFALGRSLETGEILYRINATEKKGTAGKTLSPDGSFVAISRTNGTIEIWNALTGTLIQTLATEASTSGSVSWPSDGRTFAFFYPTKIKPFTPKISVYTWDGNIWTESQNWAEINATAATLTPNGKYIHVGLSTGDLITRKIADPQFVYQKFAEQNRAIQSIAISIHGDRLLTRIEGEKIRQWDLGIRKEQHVFTSEGKPKNLIFTPDRRRIISGPTGKGVKIWDLEQQALILTIPEMEESNWLGATLSGDGRSLLVWSETELSVWDSQTGTSIRNIPVDFDNVDSVAISTSGRYVFAAMFGTSDIYIWDLASENEPRILEGEFGSRRGPWSMNQIALDPTGRYVAASAATKSIRIWDLQTSTFVEMGSEIPTHDRKLKFSSDGQRLLVLEGDSLRVWNIADQSIVFEYRDTLLKGAVVESNASATRILASRGDGKLFMWDAGWEEPRAIPMLEGLRNFTLSADGSLLATESEGTIRVWDMENDPIRLQLCRRLGLYLNPELCD